jgi:hypothetical protein
MYVGGWVPSSTASDPRTVTAVKPKIPYKFIILATGLNDMMLKVYL